MTPTLAVQFSAAADGREVDIDQDCHLVRLSACMQAATSRAVVSRDKNTTVANSVTAPANGLDYNILMSAASPASVAGNFQLYQGESLFVSASAAGTAILEFNIP